jgi:hypothetical protein
MAYLVSKILTGPYLLFIRDYHCNNHRRDPKLGLVTSYSKHYFWYLLLLLASNKRKGSLSSLNVLATLVKSHPVNLY